MGDIDTPSRYATMGLEEVRFSLNKVTTIGCRTSLNFHEEGLDLAWVERLCSPVMLCSRLGAVEGSRKTEAVVPMAETAQIQKGGGSVVGQTRGEINELTQLLAFSLLGSVKHASCSIRTLEVDGIGG